MNKFVEICQETSYCMLHPQEDRTGWFVWLLWGLALCLVISGILGSRTTRHFLWGALRQPTEYRGRLGRDRFAIVYFALQFLRGLLLVCGILFVAIFGHTYWFLLVLVGIAIVLLWTSITIYSCVVRRGHDLGLPAKESLSAYFYHVFYLFNRQNAAKHTWSVLLENKGNPYANQYGSSPEENNFLIPPERPHFSQNMDFPPIWDETDWKHWK